MRGKVVLWYFLTGITYAALVEACPSDCSCDRQIARCSSLTSLPYIPIDTRLLDLRFNRINDLVSGQLTHLRYLTILRLDNNLLTALKTGAFEGLTALETLSAHHNYIQHVDPGALTPLTSLRILDLHINQIKSFDATSFNKLLNLERLYLESNKIEHLEYGLLNNLKNLRELKLQSNPIVCDCALSWLTQITRTVAVSGSCSQPNHLRNVDLSTISSANLNCRKPYIAQEPDDVQIAHGGEAKFLCSAHGYPLPEIVWLKDAEQIPTEKDRYQVTNDGTLVIYDMDESDIGVYECMAKNSMGQVRSRPAKAIMKSPSTSQDMAAPAVSIVPQDVEVKLNNTVTFECHVTGKPRPHLTWFHEEQRILLTERIQLGQNGSLIIHNVQIEDKGNYKCQADNSLGRGFSMASLEILTSPVFTVIPSNKNVTEEDSVTFECKASGFPEPKITWYKNSNILSSSDKISFSDNFEKMTILSPSTEDESEYICQAENSEGIIVSRVEFQITPINEAPKLLLKPDDTEAYLNTSIQLACKATGNPKPTIEWRKDGAFVLNNLRHVITSAGNLLIKNVTFADAGHYECSAINYFGRDTFSASVTVKENDLPGDEYVNLALNLAVQEIDSAINKTVSQLFAKRNSSSIDISDLFQIIRFPDAPARELARAAEIYERTLTNLRQILIHSGAKINTTNRFEYEEVLTPEHIRLIEQLSGCTPFRSSRDCVDICYHRKYRNIDGSCNNYLKPMWGSSYTGFRRILPPIYENGLDKPVGWNKTIKYNGFTLPSARLISTNLISTVEISSDDDITHMVMQWGQWLDHDLDHALPSVSSQSWDGVDCKKSCEFAAPCFPIEVPENDPRIQNRRCIDFIRTSSVCGSGLTSVLFGEIQPREQLNQLTSFIDASQVYGFDINVAKDLRNLVSDDGLLREGVTYPGKKPLLPFSGTTGMDCRRNLTESNVNCFVAGDIRANEQIGLTAFHTIWMREHNRVAKELKKVNPFWDGERLYEESRKVVGAEIQLITYEHWLPIIIGSKGYEKLGPYTGYDPFLNPSISNVFATAALRFGHSLINPILHRYNEDFDEIPQGHLNLRNAFFSPWRLADEGGVDPLLRGMFITPAKLKKPQQTMNAELTERLFQTAHAVALDLAAINIQRGRDHGIPSYAEWRTFCNMSDIQTFDDMNNEISDPIVRSKLKELYGSPLNIDVWVGGILEDQIDGGKVGPLFQCLLLEQFQRLRNGDRLWYENPATFTPEQLVQIKQTSLARVICDNGDNIESINENIFILPDSLDSLLDCDDIPGINFSVWADCQSCTDDDEYASVETRSRRSVSNIETFDMSDDLKLLQDDQEKLRATIKTLEDKINSLEKMIKSN